MPFSPPNDFTDGSEDFPWGTVILGAGGGCLVLVALVGALMMWGTCAVGNGCKQNLEASQARAVAPAQRFLDDAGRDDVDALWMLMSPRFRGAHGRDDLRGLLERHGELLVGGEARLVRALPARQGHTRTFLVVQILDSPTSARGVATFVLVPARPDDPGTPVDGYFVEDVLGGLPEAELEGDAIVALVRAHVDLLAAGRIEAAAAQFEAGQTDAETYALFVEGHGDRFKDVRLEVVSLEVKRPEAVLVVELIKRDGGASAGRLTFELRFIEPVGWRLRSVGSGDPVR